SKSQPRTNRWPANRARPQFGRRTSAISTGSKGRGQVDDYAHGSNQRHQADGEENRADRHVDPGGTGFGGRGDPMRRGHDEEHARISAWGDQGAEQLLARGPGFRDPAQDRSDGPGGQQQDERKHLEGPEAPGRGKRGSRLFAAAG